MGRKKNKRYSEVLELPNFIKVSVAQRSPLRIDKIWEPTCFAREQEITLELGCGRGEYTLNLARRFPHRNFIGIDFKSDRICVGAQKAMDEKLDNVLFMKIQIEHIQAFFPENTISEAWIPFPDPHLGNENGKKRLTSERFLNIYRALLKPEGSIHLKTDDPTMYAFSRESVLANSARLLRDTDDLYDSPYDDHELRVIQTTYEKRYLAESKTIKYLNFAF